MASPCIMYIAESDKKNKISVVFKNISEKIIKKIKYSHPVFKYNKEFIFKKLQEIQGVNNIFYCGAWCGYGFHEDGVVSAKNVAKYLI